MKTYNYSFLELVNTDEIKKLMISFYDLTGLSWALIDLDGDIMTCQDGSPVSAGWQDFCLNIHRENPKILNSYIKSAIEVYNEFYSRKYCGNNLMDMAVPIYIDGAHMASLFIGHFFFNEPDIEFFREQAHIYGMDEEEYLAVINKVPVFSRDYIHKILDFLTSMAGVIGELGLEKKKLRDSKQLLQEREKRHIFALDSVHMGTWQHEFSEEIFHLDKYSRIHLNFKSSRVKPEEILDRVHPEDKDRFINAVLDALNPERNQERYSIEIRVINPDDTIRWLAVEGRVIFKEKSPLIGYGTTQDITERKMAEEALQFQLNILKNVRHCIIVYDLQGKIIYWNDSAESIYGYSEEEMLGKNIKTLYLDQEKILLTPDIEEILELGEYTGEWEGKRKDGSKVSVDIRETVLYDANNEIIGIIGVSKDITLRKNVENKIKESLEEKEVLLQEIHHRVKNNLQIISSLLNLQTEYVEGEESINVLKESQNRVKTMAMVHEKLYQSANLKDINFKEYIEDLISVLFYSYGVEFDSIKIQINLEDLKIGIDTAIPCGLIINELITNSIKYAFPGREGILKVELKQIAGDIKLVVADNGIGLPADINLENTDTLGLKMVNSLVYQLDGTLELNRTNGTEFIIKFKELKYKNRI